MIVQLRRANMPTAAIVEPVDFLLACHGRIRAITAVANRIVEATADADVAEAAANVGRFYTVALPLHAEDEDASVTPRLLHQSNDASIERALARMATDHLLVEELCSAAGALCAGLAREPETLEQLRPTLRRLLVEINAMWERHLTLEERVIFPAVARLALSERAAILRECRARREGNATIAALQAMPPPIAAAAETCHPHG